MESCRKEQSIKKFNFEDSFDEIVGLEEPKQTLRRIIAYHRLQIEAESRGIHLTNRKYHMCFTGNPGTAKTTFARATAKLFWLEGITSRNVFVEAGRAELIAPYAGQTAPKVKAVISSASGGVLFIDEAYSLMEDAKGGYGDEAISALVQELENRIDVIVILAGYPDKMDAFLSRNPGLRSRIPFVVHFPDYSCEELVKISECIASRNGFKLDSEAKTMIKSIVQKDMSKTDFGNARYVRNLVEAAQMNRACSIAFKPDMISLSDSELFTLQAEDFKPQSVIADNCLNIRTIGFSIS